MDDKLNTCICGLTACDKDDCLNKTMTDVPESVGAFIMAQPGLNPLVTANGYYWHYKDVITLMTRYREQTGARWVKASERIPSSWHLKCVRFIHTKQPLIDPETWLNENAEATKVVEWLDESA